MLGTAPGLRSSAEPAFDSGTLVQANDGFAVRLYQQLSKTEGNLFFSPQSVSSALALAYAGARGATAAEMASAQGINVSPALLAQGYGQLAEKLAAAECDGARLTVANSIWAQRTFGFRPKFLEMGTRQFRATLRPVDFVGSPEGARGEINAWVDRATAGKITDLVPPGALSAATRLVLCNAVYFKGRWAVPFNKRLTRPGDFYLGPQKPVQTAMMHGHPECRLVQVNDLRLAEMSYAGKTVSMIVLLPNARDGLPALERQLTASNLKQWLTELAERPSATVNLSLPQFTQTWSGDLSPALRALGMATAFTATADFSGISDHGPLGISSVLHRSYVTVDEGGTEAAAATGMVFAATAFRPSPRPEFHADHPFIFLLRENSTGAILFLGRLVDPR